MCTGDPGVMTRNDLLERASELAEVAEALADARRARGRVVLVEAPAGLGKTSLLAQARSDAAAAGFTALRARASELERAFA
jgi:ATP/maltotriose-dependent transcriptional regulator MalT